VDEEDRFALADLAVMDGALSQLHASSRAEILRDRHFGPFSSHFSPDIAHKCD
jgi:hypothetical protein